VFGWHESFGSARQHVFSRRLVSLSIPSFVMRSDDISVPVGREHIQTLKMLPTKPVNLIEWSILCPSVMKPAFATQELKILEQPRKREFMMKADVPPELTNPLYGKLPLVGGYLSTFNTMVNHVTTLEENADFMAEDLASGSQQWIFRRVGVKAVLSK